MESHVLHFLPNNLFKNNHRCLQSKFGYLKCRPVPYSAATKKYSLKKYMPTQHVLLTMHNENRNHTMYSTERGTQFRPACFGSENSQHIIDKCSDFSSEIVEGCAVEIVGFKENVSNDKVSIAAEEEEIENLSVNAANEDLEENGVDRFKFMESSQSLWQQMKDVVLFAGPALGIWLCGPLMSLIDTAVIGQSSSLELAALGPGTVVCDYLCYVFMFLPIATSLAQKDEVAMQQQLSRLLFVALACGIGMLLFTKAFGTRVLHVG